MCTSWKVFLHSVLELLEHLLVPSRVFLHYGNRLLLLTMSCSLVRVCRRFARCGVFGSSLSVECVHEWLFLYLLHLIDPLFNGSSFIINKYITGTVLDLLRLVVLIHCAHIVQLVQQWRITSFFLTSTLCSRNIVELVNSGHAYPYKFMYKSIYLSLDHTTPL